MINPDKIINTTLVNTLYVIIIQISFQIYHHHPKYTICSPHLLINMLIASIKFLNITIIIQKKYCSTSKGSSSSTVAADLTFKGFEVVLGGGAAMEPHKSSSSSFAAALIVLLGRTFATNEKQKKCLAEFSKMRQICYIQGKGRKKWKVIRLPKYFTGIAQKHQKQIWECTICFWLWNWLRNRPLLSSMNVCKSWSRLRLF